MKKYTKKQIGEFLLESNHIEGVYDSDSFLQAQVAWDYLSKQQKLTVENVLETHRLLMINQNLKPDEKGFFRRCKIWVGGREGYDWTKVHKAINDWTVDMNRVDQVRIRDKGKEDNYEALSKLLHIIYEKIHPFVDGNGRTGRMFMNWWRMSRELPILIIHADWPDQKGEQANYYSWFK